jgi:hypothetical protein
LVPANILADDRVQSLVDAVDHLHTSTKSNVPSQLIKDLRAAIQFRKRIALGCKEGDEGHAYFLTVLKYCSQILVAVKEAAKQKQPGKHGNILEKLVEGSNANQKEEIEDEILDEADDGVRTNFPSHRTCRYSVYYFSGSYQRY